MQELTGGVLGHDNCGTDGCSIPTYAVPIKGLAHGFARMATGEGLAPLRAIDMPAVGVGSFNRDPEESAEKGDWLHYSLYLR